MKKCWLISKKHKEIGLLLMMLASLFTSLLIAPHSVNAQNGAVVSIHSLDTSKFPAVTFNLNITDENGDFVSNLAASDLQIIENQKNLPVDNISTIKANVQIVVALNTSLVMVNQFGGKNTYQKIQQTLLDWVKRQPIGTQDDFNLAVNDGLLGLHLSQPADWLKVISSYQPNLYVVPTNLNSLNSAIEMSTDPNIPVDIKKEILYVSPAPAPTFLDIVPTMIQRAQKAGVRVDVWMVSASPVVTAKGADGLKQLAESTSGEYLVYTGREDLPDPDTYLNQIRRQYQVTYQSGITRGGTQSLALQINSGEASLDSNELTFPLDIQPPNPILLDPPNFITLPVVTMLGKETVQPPLNQIIKALIEFPDGHPRDLTRSQLYVDGELVVENTSAPFDEFLWPVVDYEENSRHMLQVKVEDSLGLSRASSPVPVDILQNPLSRTLLDEIASSERLLTASAIAAALLAVIILLWLTSRKSRFKFASSSPAARQRSAADPSYSQTTRPIRKINKSEPPPFGPAPLEPSSHRRAQSKSNGQTTTQPPRGLVLAKPNGQTPTQPPFGLSPSKSDNKVVSDLPISPRGMTLAKPACLTRLDQTNKPISGGEYQITRPEITIGSSPNKSILVIDLPSVDGLHARLVRTQDDNYFLADCGSIGGTWVNFAPVSARGVHLADGDLIHFGRTPFRFELGKTPSKPIAKKTKG